MLDNLRIHRNFIGILLLPLVLLAALAAGRIRSNVTQGLAWPRLSPSGSSAERDRPTWLLRYVTTAATPPDPRDHPGG
jgi:hypothetical protein